MLFRSCVGCVWFCCGGGDDARVLGFRAFEVRYRIRNDAKADTDIKTCQVLFKIKPKCTDAWQTLSDAIGKMWNDESRENYAKKTFDCLLGADVRELAVVNVDEPVWRAIMPDLWLAK